MSSSDVIVIIDSFQGEHGFLSNFYPSFPIHIPNITSAFDVPIACTTVEHAYSASKTDVSSRQFEIANCSSPGIAKRMGRNVSLRGDWERVKFDVMLTCLREKFSQPDLQRKLLETNKATLIEGNTWGDVVWGIYKGRGENHLGKMLMRVRKEIQNAC